MRKVISRFVPIVLLVVAAGAFAQSVDIDEIDPEKLDFSLVDVSRARVFFNGPLELYITDVVYGEAAYAAVLRYDGESTISVGRPEVLDVEGKPQAIDLSSVTIEPTPTGISIRNLIVDGQQFGGTLALLANNDLQIAEIEPGARADETVTALLRQIRALEAAIDQRGERIARLNQQIDELPEPEQVTGLRRQIGELEDDLAEARDRVSALESDLLERNDMIESLEQQADSLQSTIQSRDERIGRLNARLEELPEPERVTEMRDQLDTLEEGLETSRSDIESLEATIGARDREIRNLRERVTDLRDPWNIADDLLPTIVQTDVAAGEGGPGSWNVSRGVLVQSDPVQKFGKFAIPAVQSEDADLFYSFSGVAAARDWSGFGLHFLASGSETPNGYGYGESYLVWASRDPDVNRNDRTYVELYRSSDDTTMDKLASVAVYQDISTDMEIAVYVERDPGRLTVIVDGEELFSFSNEALIRSGETVAFRALGEVQIRDLEIRTE